MRLLRVLFCRLSKVSEDGDSTSFFICLFISVIMKGLFLRANWNFSSCNLRLLPLVLSLCVSKKRRLHLLYKPLAGSGWLQLGPPLMFLYSMLNKTIFLSWTPVCFSCMRAQNFLCPFRQRSFLASHWSAFINASQVRNLASLWTHDIPVNRFLQLVELLLPSSTALQCTNHSCQHGVSCRLTEDPSTSSSLALMDWFQRNGTHYQLLIRLWQPCNSISTLECLLASAIDQCTSRWSGP